MSKSKRSKQNEALEHHKISSDIMENNKSNKKSNNISELMRKNKGLYTGWSTEKFIEALDERNNEIAKQEKKLAELRSQLSEAKKDDLKPSYIKSPSTATLEKVASYWLTGSIAAHWSLLEAAVNMSNSLEKMSSTIKNASYYENCEKAAGEIYASACPRSYKLTAVIHDERSCTAILQALLQQYYADDKNVLWLHQYNFVDIIGMKKIKINTREKYCQPKVFFQVGLASNHGDKESQLLSYINNFWHENQFHTTQWVLCLGIVVTLTSGFEGGTFTINGYYGIKDNLKAKLGVAHIYTGTWEYTNILKLLLTIRVFCNQNNIVKPAIMDKNWLTRNVLIDKKNNEVYKVYDYRFRHTPIYRRYVYSIQHIPDCTIYHQSNVTLPLYKEKKLTIIRYPYLAGSHTASHSGQIISILKQLLSFHTNTPKYVFGDIRASNIIFQDQSACFIDFDYMGVDGVDTYPPGFSLDINDGTRHPEVEELTFMFTYHDNYSMASILSLFRTKLVGNNNVWSRVIDLVKNNKLGDAINKLETYSLGQFELMKKGGESSTLNNEYADTGTGITSCKKMRYNK